MQAVKNTSPLNKTLQRRVVSLEKKLENQARLLILIGKKMVELEDKLKKRELI